MEMCYDGALVMPGSYAVMSEDEMTYVEGGSSGNGFWNKASTIGTAINIIVKLLPLTCWMSSMTKAGKALRTVVSLAGYTKKAFVNMVSNWIVKAGLCATKSVATQVVGAVWGLTGLSLGYMIAKGIDMIDGNCNGYCFG